MSALFTHTPGRHVSKQRWGTIWLNNTDIVLAVGVFELEDTILLNIESSVLDFPIPAKATGGKRGESEEVIIVE